MESDRFQLLSDLFERAIALPADARPAFLDQHCPADPPNGEFRIELEALLGQIEKPDDPVVTAAGLDALFEEAGIKPQSGDRDGKIPDVIGGNSHQTPSPVSTASQGSGGAGHASGTPMPLLTGQYRVLRVVGEGGMGIVYEAEQAFPKRRVALKSIRPGLFSRRMLRRFQNEAHILGRLQHPGIAQIYEAGASDPQSPDDAFFVMEFVDGPALNIFAETRKLRTADKLALVIKVCDAVHHAHQRGVIHRDLKPGNILVSEAEGTGPDAQPKILDFGVARVTDDRTHTGIDRAETMRTQVGQLIGTLAYMSPEQISAGPTDVDVRTDVYALGVVMYQLLTGKLPLDLSEKSIPDAAQMVREAEPCKLGTIDRAYRGDLETIVAKALEKDRARRYQSATELGQDILRYLNGEAIAAKRDSGAYVLRKFVKRHKGAVAAAAVIFVGLVAFASFASIQARHNRVLADKLSDQLVIANADRGRLESLSGTPSLGERTLWTERLLRPDLPETYWALWEFYSRQPILKSTGGPGVSPGRVLLTPDGATLIRTSKEGEIQGWSPDLGTCLWRIEPDGKSCTAGAIAADGTVGVFVGVGGKIVLVDPGAGRVLMRPDGEGANFNAVAVAPGGLSFFTGDLGGRVVEWSTETGKLLQRLYANAQPISALAIRPDGAILVVSTQKGVCIVIDLGTGKPVGMLPLKGLGSTRSQFSSDGQRFFALDSDGVVHDFDTARFDELGTIKTGDHHASNMFLLNSGNVLTSGPAGLRVWDARTRTLFAEMPGEEGFASHIAQGPRPGTFYTAGTSTSVRLWEDSTLRCSRRLLGGTSEWMLGAAPSPDGTLIAAVDSTGMVRVWSAESGKLVGACRGPETVGEKDRRGGRALAWRPGTRRLVAGFHGGVLAEFEPSDSGVAMIASWAAHTGEVLSTTFTRDGTVLASGSVGGDILLWDAQTHERVGAIRTTQTKVNGLSFSPNASRLVVAGIGPGIALYDVRSGAMLRSIADPYLNYSVRYSPDGSAIGAARSRPEIELLDPETLAVRRTLLAHGKAVIDVAFDGSGHMLASGSADGTLRLWDTATGRQLVSLDVGAEVSCVAFVHGSAGKRLVTAGQLGSVRLWDLSYYDQHIAGNASYFLSRLEPGLGANVREKELLDWSRAAMANPALSFKDPLEGVPLRPNTPTKPGQ